MKRYRITLEDNVFDVKVLDDPRLEQVQVEVDGETFIVGVEMVPVMADMAPLDDAHDKTEEAAITVASDGGATAAASMHIPKRAATASADRTVTAPLPGVIKSIAVRTGQQVNPNDELLIIEAMKMDNIIRATRAGTVGTIYVVEGRQVAYGEDMLDLD